MRPNNPKTDSVVEAYYLEDELTGICQPQKEEIKKLCNHLHLPFNKQIVLALIYGDNKALPERMLPYWITELE